jgi:hypothetical protein
MEGEECIQNYGGETFWKVTIWKREKEVGELHED